MARIEQAQIKIRNSNGDFVGINPFPVGFIYMSSKSTSPANTYGGTWNQISDSRIWIPKESYDSLGGSSSSTVTSKFPWTSGLRTTKAENSTRFGLTTAETAFNYRVIVCTSESDVTGTYYNLSGTASTYQPDRSCYCWVRTA